MEDILRFTKFNKLKSRYRMNSVENRKESSAEHTWSSLMLADYFLSKINKKVDRLKVYELLMFHDVVEIESGDFPLDPNNHVANKKNIELKAAKVLKEKLPEFQGDKFFSLFLEFEENETNESKFANAIDKFDAIIQEIDYKIDWKGWSRQFLLDKKEKYFLEFPETKQQFYKVLDYFESEGYFNQ